MITTLIGLGNSGAEYDRTYHNVGEFVAGVLKRADPEALLNVYPVSGFMNECGGPIRAWLKMHNLSLVESVVIHDDSDLPLGSYKLSRGGGSAGHKGIESIVAQLGTSDFWRLRIGIRDPREEVRRKAGEFVLSRWNGNEESLFCAAAAAALPELRAIK